jgi:cytidine deaminase
MNMTHRLEAAAEDLPWDRLASEAAEARGHAHAPYSHFSVGAAVLTGEGRIFKGCNVENASYGLSMCAERNAVFSAVTSCPGGRPEIIAVYVCTDPDVVAPPCGACRQVLAEFGANAIVSYHGTRTTARGVADNSLCRTCSPSPSTSTADSCRCRPHVPGIGVAATGSTPASNGSHSASGTVRLYAVRALRSRDKSLRQCVSAGSNRMQGAVAQLVERLLCKQEVVGSSPIGSTT